ncbi:NAD(P)H-hydrate dehydratase [Planctomonas psychrotolerans]|uniref:NAD(P)H-hydrate dehydratase n=1 Tax=Planctomonas psychrotolerans TaxID=2528712 RepID=UPI001D0D43CD|nr:NAD(P)H-hydrate dehydratase [Planctomonas psychrotolerans]
MSSPAEIITPASLRQWPLPAPGSSKYDRGDVLVLGGARKTPGAALLAGTAALRVGAGRLTIAVAESVAPALAVAMPEAGVVGLAESSAGSVLGSSVEALADQLDPDVLLVGAGLDDPDEAEDLLRRLIPLIGADTSVHLDALALGVLPRLGDQRDAFAGRLVLTPNENEAGRLLERDVDDLDRDVSEIAEKFGAVVTCMNSIAHPDGRVWQSSSGFGGLATSGSGDVLAGAIAGVRARGASLEQAACWGTYLHAAAGDRLAARVGPLGFLARELATELPALLVELST